MRSYRFSTFLSLTLVLAGSLNPASSAADDGVRVNGSEVMTFADLFPTCRRVSGVLWCYNDGACGEACNDVCAAVGSEPIDDNTVWFEAQDTLAECEAIAGAFGLSAEIGDFGYQCLEDNGSSFSCPRSESELIGALTCSTSSLCPFFHRTEMDALGNGCAGTELGCAELPRRSVCPCKTAFARLAP